MFFMKVFAAVGIVFLADIDSVGSSDVPNVGAGAQVKKFPSNLSHIRNEDRFEDIIVDPEVALVLVVSKKYKTSECGRAVEVLNSISPELPCRVHALYIEDMKSIGYEFSIRGRKTPKLLLFRTRSRMADEVDFFDQEDSSKKLSQKIMVLLKDNVQNDAGHYEKSTLAIGAGGNEL